MKHLYSLLTAFLFSFLFYASSEVQRLQTTQTIYDKPLRSPEELTISYNEPIIRPAAETKQQQQKGDITITCEIVPFRVDSAIQKRRYVSFADPDRPGQDVYEVTKVPSYKVTPEEVRFVIRIRNNQDRILKLNEVALVSIVDGIQYSIPQENLTEWKNGLIIKGFEKTYTVNGPALSFLENAQVIYFSINDVPVQYDQAGTIIKKENFEWFFECSRKQVTKTSFLRYSYEYEPVESRQCPSCSGRGHFSKMITCSTCGGGGRLKSKYDGSVYNCRSCGGTGRRELKDACRNCHNRGVLEYPKSQMPPVRSNTSWSGWKVEVRTIPAGANVRIPDTRTGEYVSAGKSNLSVDWYAADNKEYPIIIEYQGKTVKVLPYGSNGNPVPYVLVDFRKAPAVKKGRKTE